MDWSILSKQLFGLDFLYLLIRRYVGGMASTVDLLEFFPDAPAVDPEIRTALRNQAEVLVGKLAPGYIFQQQF